MDRDDLDRRLREHFAAIDAPLPQAAFAAARAHLRVRRGPRLGGLLAAASLASVALLAVVVAVGTPAPDPFAPSTPVTAAPTSSEWVATPPFGIGFRYRVGQTLRVGGHLLGEPYEAYPGDRLYVIDTSLVEGQPIYRLEGPPRSSAEDASYIDVPAGLIERAAEPVDVACPAEPGTVSELLQMRPFERALCLADRPVTVRIAQIDSRLIGTTTMGTSGAGSLTPSQEPERGSLPFSLAEGMEIRAPGWYRLTGRFGLEDATCGSVTGRLRCQERFIVDAVEPGAAPTARLDGTWTRMSDAPITGRSGYVAVPIGRGVFIWGGVEEGGANQGAIYETSADRWTLIARAPGPDRLRPAAVWTGAEILIWGGLGGDPGGLRYDPATDRWSAIEPGPIASGASVGAWTGDHLVVVNDQAEAASWDPSSGAWQRLPDAPVPPGYIEGAWTGGELIVLGLTDGGRDPVIAAALSPETGRWRSVAETPYDGLELGYEPIWTGSDLLFAYHAYDPATDDWRALQRDGCDLYAGVSGVWTGNLVMSQAVAYDPAAGRCLSLPESPPRTGYPFADDIRTHEFHTPAWDGGLIVWSGYTGLDGPAANPDGVVFRPAVP